MLILILLINYGNTLVLFTTEFDMQPSPATAYNCTYSMHKYLKHPDPRDEQDQPGIHSFLKCVLCYFAYIIDLDVNHC
jgi:hypothetical protein